MLVPSPDPIIPQHWETKKTCVKITAEIAIYINIKNTVAPIKF